MDRYGASTRECPLGCDDDYDRGYGRGNSMRERGTLRGERSGRDHRSGLYDDEDSDSDESEHEPRDHYHGGARGVRGAGPRHGALSPSTRGPYDNDSEFEHGDREVRGQRFTHGATSRHSGPRYTGDYSDDESEFEPRATRGGHGGPGAGRGADPRRPDRRFNSEYSDDESDLGPRLAPGGRRSMAPPRADYRGPAYAGSMDGESEYGPHGGPRPGYGRGAPRGGMMHHPRRQGRGASSDDDDLDESEDEDLRGGRRGAVSYGRSTGRGLY